MAFKGRIISLQIMHDVPVVYLCCLKLSICGSPDPDPTPEKKSTPDSGVRFSGIRESRMVPKRYFIGGMCPNKHIFPYTCFCKMSGLATSLPFAGEFSVLQNSFSQLFGLLLPTVFFETMVRDCLLSCYQKCDNEMHSQNGPHPTALHCPTVAAIRHPRWPKWG
jgi:hypothetical protein